MTDYQLAVETSVRPADLAVLESSFAATYPDLQGKTERRELGIFVHEKGGALCGGVYGWIAGGWLYIDTLWLDESLRGAGYGTRLMRLIEDAAAERGVRRSFLTTTNFQARPFYERLGYVVFTTHPEYISGHDLYSLKKENLGPLAEAERREIEAAYRLKLEDPPNLLDAQELEECLAAFNHPYIGEVSFGPLAVFVRHPHSGSVAGGLAGWRYGHSLSVECIGFDEHLRATGWAGRAIHALEQTLATASGRPVSPYILIRFTGSYAFPLFQESGYTVAGVHEDFPEGYTTYIVQKPLPR